MLNTTFFIFLEILVNIINSTFAKVCWLYDSDINNIFYYSKLSNFDMLVLGTISSALGKYIYVILNYDQLLSYCFLLQGLCFAGLFTKYYLYARILQGFLSGWIMGFNFHNTIHSNSHNIIKSFSTISIFSTAFLIYVTSLVNISYLFYLCAVINLIFGFYCYFYNYRIFYDYNHSTTINYGNIFTPSNILFTCLQGVILSFTLLIGNNAIKLYDSGNLGNIMIFTITGVMTYFIEHNLRNYYILLLIYFLSYIFIQNHLVYIFIYQCFFIINSLIIGKIKSSNITSKDTVILFSFRSIVTAFTLYVFKILFTFDISNYYALLIFVKTGVLVYFFQ